MNKKRMKEWVTRPRSLKDLAQDISQNDKLITLNGEKMSPIVVEYLMSKGYDTVEKINSFINFDESQLRNYKTYKDSEKFLDVLIDSLKNHENIVIYGDYDADGVCATTVWYRGLTRVKGNVNFFINNRFTEGYGLNIKGVKRLLETYPDTNLIITCDNGVVAFEGIEYALSQGVKVIVSDHHVAKDNGLLPNCPVVCEHRLDESQELKENICGAEMSRRLLIGLYDRIGLAEKQKAFLDSLASFSGIATVADSVPLGPANHFLIKFGLSQIEKNHYPVWGILRDLLDIKSLDETSIGFNIGPVLNAVSRITGDVTEDVLMFTSDDELDITNHVRNLIEFNKQRKEMSKENNLMAEMEYIEKRSKDSLLMFSDSVTHLTEEDSGTYMVKHYDEGICGLVCSHMLEEHGKPCITLTPLHDDPTTYKGSARSVPGFNIKEALDKLQDLLVGYGGHELAAGLSIKEENIPLLRESLCKLVDENGVLNTPIKVEIDYVITPDDTSDSMVRQLESLAPFGVGLERPNICMVGKIENYTMMPVKDPVKKHVSINMVGENKNVKVLWWNSVKEWEEILKQEPDKLAVIGKLSLNSFNGKINTQLIVDNGKVKMFSNELIKIEQ